jgi:3-oxoacid CoA-transferase A subunit
LQLITNIEKQLEIKFFSVYWLHFQREKGGIFMNKIKSTSEAVTCIKDYNRLMVGGFGLDGCPLSLVDALSEHIVHGLTVISINLGEPGGKGLGKILYQNKIAKAIRSYFTSNPDIIRFVEEGRLEVELIPQETLSEAIRAGGIGLGGFYTRNTLNTILSGNKERKWIDGVEYVLEKPLRANVSLIKAWIADTMGNLVYHKKARNFNPVMAMAADIVIAEVDEIVDMGDLDPEFIVTPHTKVNILVKK